MTINAISDPTTGRARRRKVAAVLAGGLVLGVGTMATLASWNDSEFASATFTAGSFGMVGAVDTAQASFSNHSTAGSGGLTFTAPAAFVGNLTPNDTVYAGYALQLDKNTTNDASVVVTAEPAVGNPANLSYTLFTTTLAGCSSAATAVKSIVSAGTAISSVGTAPLTIDLAKSTQIGTNPGATVFLCFKVTAGPNLQPGQAYAPEWKFQATSKASA